MTEAVPSRPPCYQGYGDPDTASPRTYVVLGTPRGGTSMAAGLARLCGLPMGEDLPHNHEDPDFNVDQLRAAGHRPVARIRQTVERRNAEHDVWGWKYPRAAGYLDEIRAQLRNPHLVVVLRDPVAAADRAVRFGEGDPMQETFRFHEMQGRNLDLVRRWQVPTLMVSYERSVTRPFVLATRLAAFLGMPAPTDPELVRGFVRRGVYQDVPEPSGSEFSRPRRTVPHALRALPRRLGRR